MASFSRTYAKRISYRIGFDVSAQGVYTRCVNNNTSVKTQPSYSAIAGGNNHQPKAVII